MSLELIEKTDYIGFLNIDFDESDATFRTYADQHEEAVLTELFGSTMYTDMVANPTEANYVYLIETYLTSMQRSLFYWSFLLDRASYSTTLGEFQSDAENATRLPQGRNVKVIKQYNVGVNIYTKCAEYVQQNTDEYPLYTETIPKTLKNVWGIDKGINSGYLYPCDHGDWFIRGCR